MSRASRRETPILMLNEDSKASRAASPIAANSSCVVDVNRRIAPMVWVTSPGVHEAPIPCRATIVATSPEACARIGLPARS